MPTKRVQVTRSANGKMGELLVELELTSRGWHVERLDGSTYAANGDLIAIKGSRRCVIQVKTNGSQSNRATLGYAAKFLNDGTVFFNSKDSPIMIDAVICVTFSPDFRKPVFHVFKVEEAEAFAQADAKTWFGVTKKDGQKRSASFPVSPLFSELIKFRDEWDKLEN